MKKTKLALAISTSLIAATPAMATNGTNMIGVGAESRALGGTGVAAYYGAESVINNPGLVGKSKGTEFAFGGTLFKPTVKNNGLFLGASQTEATSSADSNVIPSVSLTSRISDKLSFGIGMYGTSGMGVDYSDKKASLGTGQANEFEAQTNMQIMRFVPTLAYNSKSWGIGLSPIIQYGSLDINYVTQARDPAGNPLYVNGNSVTTAQSTTPYMKTVGKGMASDLGQGFGLGGYFNLSKNLTLALNYTSAINMKYKGQLSTASTPFVNPLSDFKKAFGDELEQPAELSAGVAYDFGKFTLTGDFKQIKWGDAKGYKDFKWENQNVIALGAKYTGKGYWVGLGYNKADNPIKEQNGATSYKGAVINMFNNIFFPATVESHMTFGGGYTLTKHVNLDMAVVIANESTTKVNTSAVSAAFTGAPNNPNAVTSSSNTTKHSQVGYTMTVSYAF